MLRKRFIKGKLAKHEFRAVWKEKERLMMQYFIRSCRDLTPIPEETKPKMGHRLVQQMQMSPVRQAELHSDLKIQEKDELQWKKIKVEGLDENGEKEAQLRRNFNVILAKYGMDGKRDTRPMESNSLKDHDSREGDMFEDPRLDKLWNKAKGSGKFSDEELLSLKREFQHHKDKIHEYSILMDTISRTEEIHKNVISPLEGEAKEQVLQHKHTDLKQKMRDLNQGFERLRRLSHEGFTEDSDFHEPRVIELWEAARRSNLTEDELDSLKEELRHFETKVEKHSHYQEQLELSHQKLQHVEALGDKEHIKRNQEKYNTLSEKTREMGYKMKKHMQDLSNKILRSGLKHNEL
uniref:Low density lipoprotein receptor-related protein associated protein 1 n=2 Tax=Cynoglossus semilaevis TaxID=244447 RepID=A0A3P8W588_CYNSE